MATWCVCNRVWTSADMPEYRIETYTHDSGFGATVWFEVRTSDRLLGLRATLDAARALATAHFRMFGTRADGPGRPT